MIGGIDRIELLRGANSLPWGSQAIGGVVSVTTTRPPADGSDRTTGRFGAEVGARDTVRLNGQLRTAALGPAEFGIGAGYVRTDGISNAAVGTDRAGYRQVSVNLPNCTPNGATVEFSTFRLLAAPRVEPHR